MNLLNENLCISSNTKISLILVIFVIKDQCVSHDLIYIKGNMHKYFNISIFCTILHRKIFRGLSIDDICGLN